MLRRWIDKWKAAQARDAALRAEADRLFNEARDSRVLVKVTINTANGGSYVIKKEIGGWAYRCALGDEVVHARKRAEEWFTKLCAKIAVHGYTTPDGHTHFPPAQVVKIKRSDFIAL